MALPTSSRTAQRYVGDPRTRLVHDLFHEDPTPTGCNLLPLFREGRALRFEPDRLEQARREGFQPCPHCLFKYRQRRPRFTQDLLGEKGEGP